MYTSLFIILIKLINIKLNNVMTDSDCSCYRRNNLLALASDTKGTLHQSNDPVHGSQTRQIYKATKFPAIVIWQVGERDTDPAETHKRW